MHFSFFAAQQLGNLAGAEELNEREMQTAIARSFAYARADRSTEIQTHHVTKSVKDAIAERPHLATPPDAWSENAWTILLGIADEKQREIIYSSASSWARVNGRKVFSDDVLYAIERCENTIRTL